MFWLSVGEVGKGVCVLIWFVLVLVLSGVVVVVFGVAMVLFCVFRFGVLGVFSVVGVKLVLVGLCVSVVVLFTLFVDLDWW